MNTSAHVSHSTGIYTRSLSLSTRRFLVGGRVALFFLSVACWIGLRADASFMGWQNIGLMGCFFVHFGLALLLFWRSAVWRLGNAPISQLDEREVQVQAQAYISAYRILGLAVTLGLVVFLEIYPDSIQALTHSLGTPWVVLLVLSMLNLPSDIIAWTEQDV